MIATTYMTDLFHLILLYISSANPSIVIEADSSNALQETCGICGTQNGQLLQLDGTIARTMAEIADFVESYRVPARDQSLRPQRPECGMYFSFFNILYKSLLHFLLILMYLT